MNPIMKKSFTVLALSTLMTTGAAYAATNDLQQTNTVVPVTTSQSTTLPISIQINGEAVTEKGFQKSGGTEPMLPLRTVAENLGFTLVWNQESLSVDLTKKNLFTTVKTGEDRYSINKMLTTLGTAPELLDNKLYVPASFVSKVLHGTVTTEGNSVAISLEEQQKTMIEKGVITAIKNSGNYASVQIKGVGMDGIVLNVGKDTVYQMADGTKLNLSDLHIGLTVEAEHSMAATLSLPPQTPTYKITVLDAKKQADLLGTSGTIEEVRSNTDGSTSLLIKGTGLNDQSPSEVILQLTNGTSFINNAGETVEKSTLVKGVKVVGFYQPAMTKSLPPIGHAWKIVVELTQK
ncbi:copper amine oxidase N-terminal domain-containing protein [Paenibacillus sp. SYP-B3998]|uniref:Copper amine oxidase N-terminal domain-containing protein n=1 Tax=Paenibacillus sp. SYP-B3998 TaxID=2678564 RepID=A0A6G3ZRH0_9BACL|nr:copper amine oxidase N-terminal domain-containing protein [Paenibacillus sp. SYP-B3998]NEW04806.1 copper amine oxidase N-terminal domain-containing protein [Paenibacillus sp. SYP-B3998]